MDFLSSDDETDYAFDPATLLADLNALEESNAKLAEFIQEYTSTHRRVISTLRTNVLAEADKWYKRKSARLKRFRKSLVGMASPASGIGGERNEDVKQGEGGVARRMTDVSPAQRLLADINGVMAARNRDRELRLEGLSLRGKDAAPKAAEESTAQSTTPSMMAPTESSHRLESVRTGVLSGSAKNNAPTVVDSTSAPAKRTPNTISPVVQRPGFTAVNHPPIPAEQTDPEDTPMLDLPPSDMGMDHPGPAASAAPMASMGPATTLMGTITETAAAHEDKDSEQVQPYKKVQTAICSVRRGGKRKSMPSTRPMPGSGAEDTMAKSPNMAPGDTTMLFDNIEQLLMSSISPSPEPETSARTPLTKGGRGGAHGVRRGHRETNPRPSTAGEPPSSVARSSNRTSIKRPASPANLSSSTTETEGVIVLPEDPQVFSTPTMLSVFNGSLKGPVWHITDSKRAKLQFMVIYDGELALNPTAEPKLMQRVPIYDLAQYEHVYPYIKHVTNDNYPTVPIFQRVQDNDFLYLGHYTFEQYENVSVDEWRNFPEYVKKNWAKEVSKGDEFSQDCLYDAGITRKKREKLNPKEVLKWFYAKGGEGDGEGEITLSKIIFEPVRWETKMYDALVEANGDDEDPVRLSNFMESVTPPPLGATPHPQHPHTTPKAKRQKIGNEADDMEEAQEKRITQLSSPRQPPPQPLSPNPPPTTTTTTTTTTTITKKSTMAAKKDATRLEAQRAQDNAFTFPSAVSGAPLAAGSAASSRTIVKLPLLNKRIARKGVAQKKQKRPSVINSVGPTDEDGGSGAGGGAGNAGRSRVGGIRPIASAATTTTTMATTTGKVVEQRRIIELSDEGEEDDGGVD